jgi:uncharacterized protein (DUF2384 family)
MNEPQFSLVGRVPADRCATATGAREVEDLLRRINADVVP